MAAGVAPPPPSRRVAPPPRGDGGAAPRTPRAAALPRLRHPPTPVGGAGRTGRGSSPPRPAQLTCRSLVSCLAEAAGVGTGPAGREDAGANGESSAQPAAPTGSGGFSRPLRWLPQPQVDGRRGTPPIGCRRRRGGAAAPHWAVGQERAGPAAARGRGAEAAVGAERDGGRG